MFEAEIKYALSGSIEPPGQRLADAVYRDAYFDVPDGSFYASGQELRLREMGGRTSLTYKRPPFDAATASKEELETGLTDPEAMREILAHLGFSQRMAFTKHCRRFRDVYGGLVLNGAIVSVDFSPETFVEIEHLAATRPEGLASLPVIRAYAADLGLTRECPACYTDLYRNAQCGERPELPTKEKESL